VFVLANLSNCSPSILSARSSFAQFQALSAAVAGLPPALCAVGTILCCRRFALLCAPWQGVEKPVPAGRLALVSFQFIP